ncbi:hypothetical protein D3C79_916970 [compost metagenome]
MRQRIGGIVQRAAHTPADVETARHANHADGVQTVGILDDFRLQGFRRNGGRKAVRFDGMDRFGDVLRFPIQLRERQSGFLRRHA